NKLDAQSFFVFYDVGGLTPATGGTVVPALLPPVATFTSGATPASDWLIIPELTTGSWSGGISQIISQGGIAGLPDSPVDTNIRFQYVGPGFASGASSAALGT